MSVRIAVRVSQNAMFTPCCVSVVPVNAVAMPPPPVFGSRAGITTVAVAIRVEVAVKTAVAFAGDGVAATTVPAATVSAGEPLTKTGVLSAVPPRAATGVWPL